MRFCPNKLQSRTNSQHINTRIEVKITDQIARIQAEINFYLVFMNETISTEANVSRFGQ